MDNNLLNFEEIEKISKLPNSKYLHGELIGLLNQPGVILSNILEKNSQNLIVTLEKHESNTSSWKFYYEKIADFSHITN